MATKHGPVTWARSDDLRCAILGAMGFSTHFIGQETGLTPCQISYRLKKAKIKRADYRNGQSVVARRILERVAPTNPVAIRRVLQLKQIEGGESGKK